MVEAIGKRHDDDPTRENQNGAFRVRFRDGYKAIFKVCDAVPEYSYESWKAEILAHAIDRVFAINRCPAVVPRALNVFDNVELVGSSSERAVMDRNRRDISKICQGSQRTFFGSMMGWSDVNVQEAKNIHIHYTEKTVFDTHNMLQHNIEFARTVISLYLTGQPHKFNHNVYGVPAASNSTDVFLISLDNDRAAWELPDDSERYKFDRNLPACDRAPGKAKFKCSQFSVGRVHEGGHQVLTKISMLHLESFISTACIFPRTLSSRIRRFSEGTNDTTPSQLIKHFVAESLQNATASAQAQRDANIFHYFRWSSKVFDDRVVFLAAALHSCIERYTYTYTVFGLEDPDIAMLEAG